MWEAFLNIFSISTISFVLSFSAPVVFASLGETLSEKGGVMNLSVEGTMMLCAMTGFAVAMTTNSLILGFLAAMLIGSLMAAIVAFCSITLKRDQVAIGFILAILGIRLSSYLGGPFIRKPGPAVQSLSIPVLSKIPVLGPIFFDQDIVTYLSFILIITMWFWFYKTQPGLKLIGTGERPAAAFARGVNVIKVRYLYSILGGALIGFGGAAFSLHTKLGWTYRHTEMYGWIALAIVIFGGWHPFRAALGAYMFGLLSSAATIMQVALPGVPVQVFPLLPFPLMILMLVLFNSEWVTRVLVKFPASLRRILTDIIHTPPPAGLGAHYQQDG